MGGERPWLYPIYEGCALYDVLYTSKTVLTPVNHGILIETRFWSIRGPLMSPTTLFTSVYVPAWSGRGTGRGGTGVPRVVVYQDMPGRVVHHHGMSGQDQD